MSYARADVAWLNPGPGPHPAASPYDKAVGQALGVRAFGLYQVELPPGGQTVCHDHTDDRAEDVYPSQLIAMIHSVSDGCEHGEQPPCQEFGFIAGG